MNGDVQKRLDIHYKLIQFSYRKILQFTISLLVVERFEVQTPQNWAAFVH